MKDNKALKYLTLITGVLTLLLGVYTLVRPMRTFLAIGWILGILLFVNGIELVILSSTNRASSPPTKIKRY